MQAFQQAGSARRKNTSGSEGVAADRERERKLEKERRERARERDRKTRARATGDIDGTVDLVGYIHKAFTEFTLSSGP